MADQKKSAPGGAPLVAGELAGEFRRAAGEKEQAADVRVRLSIEGGNAAERYRYHFEAAGSGAFDCALQCLMTGREGRAAGERMSRADFTRLVRAVDVPALLSSQRPLRGIPPDSLVGRLEIAAGSRQAAFLFLADPEQAADAGVETPAEVVRVVEEIYSVSEKYMKPGGLRSVRP
jgi:hypothetical protein